MKNKELSNTKKSLTIIFTLLVFLIAIFLEGVFFTSKYIKSINTEKKELILATSLIQNKFINLNNFIDTFDLGNKILNGKKMKILGTSGIDETLGGKGLEKTLFINFIIIDKNDNEIIFSNIKENIGNDLIEESLFNLKYSDLIQRDGFFVKKFNINGNKINYDFILYKKLRYSFDDYISDLIYFIIFTLLFSIIFYYIGYKFVSKNLEPVEKSLKSMQDFIHNAGHELKTPISIIHGNLQLLDELKKYDKKLINEGIKEIDRLNSLIDGLLELSNIDIPNGKEDINIKNEIEKIIKEYEYKLSKKAIKLSFVANYELILNINKQYFYILFTNLLANAIKYTKKGGEIKILLNKISLEITDNGIGIDKENLKKIFNRFYQVDKSRNSKGFGIGLSLVKKILDIYNWKINVISEKNQGTKFIIRF